MVSSPRLSPGSSHFSSVAIFPIDALLPLLMRLLPPLLWSRRVEQGMGSAALLGLSQVLVNT